MSKEFIDKFQNDKRFYYLLLLGSFFILSILAVLPFWSTGYLYSGADMQFHLSRIQEMVENIKEGSFIPQIATHTFNQSGSVVVASYPWVTLYPFALFVLILKPVSAIYLGMAFYIFLTLIIGYYSMHILSGSKKISFYFAILYGYTSFFIFNVLNFEFGTFLSYPFFPLAVTGLYLIMFKNYKRWYVLTLGVIGVMYSHIPSTLILVVTLMLFYLLLFKFQNKGEIVKRFFYLSLSAVVTLFLSLIVWGNLINVLINQKVNKPQPEILTKGAIDLGSIFLDTFTNFNNSFFNSGMGIGILGTLVFGWFFINKLPVIAQKMYKYGIITLFIMSIVFPWYIVHYIPLFNSVEGIQLMNRVYPIAIMFLAGSGAYLLQFFDSKKGNYNISFIAIAVICMFSWFGGISFININSNISGSGLKNEPELNYRSNYNGHMVPKINVGFPVENYKINDDEYYNQFGDEDASGVSDYYPIKASGNEFNNISYHNVNYGKQNFISLDEKDIISGLNAITYNMPIELYKDMDISVPFLYYKGFKYYVTVNGKEVNYSEDSTRNTIKFNMPSTESNPVIHVQYLVPGFSKLFEYLSIFTWLLLIIYIIYYRYKLSKRIGGD